MRACSWPALLQRWPVALPLTALPIISVILIIAQRF